MSTFVLFALFAAIIAIGALAIFAVRRARVLNQQHEKESRTAGTLRASIKSEFIRSLSPWDVVLAIAGAVLLFYCLR